MKHAIVKQAPRFPVNGTTAQNEEAYLALMLGLDGNNRAVPVSRAEDRGRDNPNGRKRIAMQGTILRHIIDNHDQTIEDIAGAVGLSSQTTGVYIVKLEGEGHITAPLEASAKSRRKVCSSTREGRLFSAGSAV